MRARALVVLTLFGGILVLGGPVSGAMIYMTDGVNEASAVATVKALFEAMGATVTVGVTPPNLDGTVDLTGYDAVILNVGCTLLPPSIPEAGEDNLKAFVEGGGGLVTAEWLIWTSATVNGTLDDVLPATKGTTASIAQTYVPVTPDTIINAGLLDGGGDPRNVVFTSTAKATHAGTKLTAKAGATVFYDGSTSGAGLVGWDAVAGRAISFNCLIGDTTLQSQDFQTLLVNATDWVLPEGVVMPEPGTLSLLALAGVGVLLRRKR